MPYFTPPTRLEVPTTLPGNHPGNVLFRHFGPRRRGVNVFVYEGPQVTETERDGVVPEHTYHGGHIHLISDAEAAVLAAAGYGDNITNPISGGDAVYGAGLYGAGIYGGAA